MKKVWLTTWAWIDEQTALHIEIPALLKHMGAEDTEANRELAFEWAKEYLRQNMPKATIVSDA